MSNNTELKEYVVVKTPESEFEVWTRKTYENYIKGALSVGAAPAYKLITTFNADEQLTEPGQPVPAGEWNFNMADAPRDGTRIQAWHVLWDCPLPVKWMGAKGPHPNLPWVCITYTHSWPEDAFYAWKLSPPSPKQDNQ